MIKPILNKLFWGLFRHFLSDRQYALFRYWLEIGDFPDIENPKQFAEKIQYIKLYQRTDLRKKVADRIQVRSYVANKIGEEHLIPLIGNYQELTEEIWTSLPSLFVLKANHGCKMNKIVTEKREESFSDVRSLTQKWQQTDYYKLGREWVYKDLPRTILAEELLQTPDGTVPEDYKFFCFNGRVELIQVDFSRFDNHRRNLYDRDFNLMPATLKYGRYEEPFEKPEQLNEAIRLAEKLSPEFDFIRVDLYIVEKKIYFGELTNYPGNGFETFTPESFDRELGSKLQLSSASS